MNWLLPLILIILVLVVIIIIAYAVTATYQQTITLTIPFPNTYRYVDKVYKINTIEITVTGSIKKKTKMTSTNSVKKIIEEVILKPYEGLIIQESSLLSMKEQGHQLIPVPKIPTLENLTVLFFKKLAPKMPKIGCQLASIQLESEDLKVTHSRYRAGSFKSY